MIKLRNILIPGLVVGVATLVASIGFNFLSNALFPDLAAEYIDSGIFRPWSDPVMQMFFAYPFILGLILAFAWARLKSQVKGESVFSRGLNFGLSYFLVATIPGMFITYTSFQVSLGLVLSWTASGLIEGIVAGWVLAQLNK